ncbi:MAG: HlyD family efflux transporter periplasmic adaptor subunit [Gammaproteobacteria bacterium]|nr:HlyD family efflux transporter periplasmic adaptor subunit [Gammaproteobacteria bacterium]
MKSQKKKFILLLILIAAIFSALTHCHHTKQNTSTHLMTAKMHPISNTLYYSGTIEPLKTTIITCPADAVIEKKYFHYGDIVKRNQLLFTLSSQKLLKDYRDSLMQYIKSKTEFVNAETSMKQTEYLHQKQLVSDDEFNSKQNAFWQARLSLVQAKATLDSISQQLSHQDISMTDLTIKDINPIISALHTDAGTLKLEVRANTDGIVLQPYDDNGNASNAKKLARGTQVKQGDVLALMGNTDKILVRIYVNEFSINQLKLNQPVTLTGDAFSGMTLHGIISGMDHQGERADNGGLPTFPVEVTVSQLTPAEQAIIHIGMRAKVEIEIHDAPGVTVPIAAIQQNRAGNWLTVRDTKTGKTHDVKIQAGQTTQDDVVITAGIRPGDQIVVPDPTETT